MSLELFLNGQNLLFVGVTRFCLIVTESREIVSIRLFWILMVLNNGLDPIFVQLQVDQRPV